MNNIFSNCKVNFCTGFGQTHTGKITKKPYPQTDLNEILEMVKQPQNIDKSKAKWAIFTAENGLRARETAYLKENATYRALWADIDQGNRPLDSIKQAVGSFADVALIYSTKGSTDQNKKWRVIIPTAFEIKGVDYGVWQKVLNNHFDNQLIKPDRATERINQLCYLPNKGEFYEFAILENGDLLSREKHLDNFEFEQEIEKQEIEQRNAKREESRQKNLSRLNNGEISPIQFFNAQNSIAELLEKYGYEKSGDRWISPYSTSQQAGVSIAEDGLRWFSNHESDHLAGLGSFGDAFDLFKHFEHRGDYNKALKLAGEEITQEGLSITKLNQQNYMERQNLNGAFDGLVLDPVENLANYPDVKVNKAGVVTALKPTKDNLIYMMKIINYQVGFDVFLKRMLANGVVSNIGDLENKIISDLKNCCAKIGLAEKTVDTHLTQISHENLINKPLSWLQSLAPLGVDVDPIAELVDVLPFTNKQWAEVALKRWFIQAVAATDLARQTPNKRARSEYSAVLVFVGGQGAGKTNFMRSLLPKELQEFYKDGVLLDLQNKDSILKATSSWITELGEMESTFRKSDISALKAFITSKEDIIRLPYAKAATTFPRQTVFFASVNSDQFLFDETGNRRYLPLTVSGALSLPKGFDPVSVWQWAWQTYLNGEQWWLTPDETKLHNEVLSDHEVNEFDQLFDVFDFDNQTRDNRMTGFDILKQLGLPRDRSQSTRLGSFLKKIGVEKINREYLLPPSRAWDTGLTTSTTF